MKLQSHVTKVEIGIHTISLYAKNLKYQEVQKVIDRQVEKGRIRPTKRDSYNIDRSMKDTYFVNQGIKMFVYQTHNKSNGISFVVNPRSLLKGKYQPTELWCVTKKSYQRFIIGLETCMQGIGLELESAEELSLSQMDLTMNLWLDDDIDLTKVIRLFQHCRPPRYFERKRLKKADKETNKHCFILKSKDIVIKAYDKIYELQRNGRCPSNLKGRKLLRIEVSLKRDAFLQKLSLERSDRLHDMLYTGFHHAESVIEGYLHKMFPCSGEFLSYKKAKRTVEKNIKDERLKDRMLFLIKETSRNAGLDIAAQMLKKRYKNVHDRELKSIYSEFDKLEINPITLLD